MTKFRGFAVAAVAVWLAVPVAVQPASAVLITGDIELSAVPIAGSGVTWDTATQTISFPLLGAQVDNATGDLAILQGAILQWQQGVAPATTSYTNLTGPLLAGGQLGVNMTFSLDAPATFNDTAPFLLLSGTGTLTLNVGGFDPTPGTFLFSAQGGGGGHGLLDRVSFSADVVAIPGPVVGAGFPGLLAACAGLIGFARRRRREQIA